MVIGRDGHITSAFGTSYLMRHQLVEAPHVDVLIGRVACDERHLPAVRRDCDLAMATDDLRAGWRLDDERRRPTPAAACDPSSGSAAKADG
jgi:hypothetical protein